MGPRIRRGTRLSIGGLAAGGVVVAHLAAFLLVAPDPVRRQQLLASTGHGAWPLILTMAMGALVIGLVGLAARPPAGPGWRVRGSLLGRLLLLQVAGFLLLESLERLAMGKGPGGLVELPFEPVIVIGLLAQVVAAVAAVVLLVVLDRIIVKLVEVLTVSPRAPRTLGPWPVADLHLPLPKVAGGPANPRAPPRRI